MLLVYLFPWFHASNHNYKQGMALGYFNPGNFGELDRVAAGEFLFEMGPHEQDLSMRDQDFVTTRSGVIFDLLNSLLRASASAVTET